MKVSRLVIFILCVVLMVDSTPLSDANAATKLTALERLEQVEIKRESEEMKLQMGLGLSDDLKRAYEQLAKEYPNEKDVSAWIQYRLAEVDYSRDLYESADQKLQLSAQKSINPTIQIQSDLLRSSLRSNIYNPRKNDKDAEKILDNLEKKHSSDDHVKVTRAFRNSQEQFNRGEYDEAQAELSSRMVGRKFRNKPTARQKETPWEKQARRQYNEDLVKAEREAAFILASQGDYDGAYNKLDQLLKNYKGDNPYNYFTMNTTLQDLEYQKAQVLLVAGKNEQAIKELKQFVKKNATSYLANRAQGKLDELVPKKPEVFLTQVNVSQTDAMGCVCGPASLKEALSKLGVETSLEKLIKDAGTTEEGTSMYGLITAAKKAGVISYGFQIPADQLIKVKLPAIILMQNHFVTITEISGDSVSMYDPQVGWIQRSLKDITTLWDGNIIVFADSVAVAMQGVAGVISLSDEKMKSLKGKYTCSNAGGLGGVPGGPECNQPCGNFQMPHPPSDGNSEMQTSTNRVYGNAATETPNLPYEGSNGMNTELKTTFNSTASENRPSPVGEKWSLSYTERLVTSGLNIELEASDGSRLTYTRNIDGSYTSPPNNFDTLVKNGDGSYTVQKKDKDNLEFNSSGKLLSQTDSMGQGVNLEYNSSGKLNKILDTNGTVTTLIYGSNGDISAIDANGQYQIDFQYDSSNRLTEIKYPDDQSYKFNYSSGVSITDRNGQTTKFVYANNSGQVSARINPAGSTMNINAANPDGGSITNYGGQKDTFTWNDKQVLTSVTDPIGNKTLYEYTPDNKISVVTDPLGNKTKYYYDSRGNNTSVEDALGHRTRYIYDEDDQLTDVIDPLGNRTTYTYNDLGNLVAVTNPAGKIMTYEYDTKGFLIKATDFAGASVSYVYDNAGRQIEYTNPLGKKTSYEYDALGRRTAEIDAKGFRTEYEFNYYGQIIEVTHPDGSIESMSYSGNLLQSRTDQNGHTTAYLYDDLGRLIKVTDPLGNTTQYAYDLMGNLTSTTDAKGRVTLNTYDVKNRLTSRTLPGNKKEYYTYDANDRVATYKGVDGITTTYTYDALGRVVKRERK